MSTIPPNRSWGESYHWAYVTVTFGWKNKRTRTHKWIMYKNMFYYAFLLLTTFGYVLARNAACGLWRKIHCITRLIFLWRRMVLCTMMAFTCVLLQLLRFLRSYLNCLWFLYTSCQRNIYYLSKVIRLTPPWHRKGWWWLALRTSRLVCENCINKLPLQS
jgi:hypothetical protein